VPSDSTPSAQNDTTCLIQYHFRKKSIFIVTQNLTLPLYQPHHSQWQKQFRPACAHMLGETVFGEKPTFVPIGPNRTNRTNRPNRKMPYYTQSLPDSPLHFRMVQVPGGTYQMGSPDDDPDAFGSEKPAHPVRLDGFWLGECAVTQALWEAVLGNNPAHFKGAQRPVEQVSWLDAAVFCNALSHQTGCTPVYRTPDGQQPYGWDGQGWSLPNEGTPCRDLEASGYRLPTEAEWEYAAKAGQDYRYAGADLLDQVGWYSSNSDGETHEVGLLLPNAWGLYDLSGNVWEWCDDWWGDYSLKAQENPRGPAKGASRVLRGGLWGSRPPYCRPASRHGGEPGRRGIYVGFRLALQSVV
jgi:formylglycine-generating enzyme